MRFTTVARRLCIVAVAVAATGHTGAAHQGTHAIQIEVPEEFVGFVDVNRLEPGVQIRVHVRKTPTILSVVDAATGEDVASGPLDGFEPHGTLPGGERVFVWGRARDGRVRLWTPAFDTERSLRTMDPALPCTTSRNPAVPIAGSFVVDVPRRLRRHGSSASDVDSERDGRQLRASIYAKRRDKGFSILAESDSPAGRTVVLGIEHGHVAVRGGFAFAEVVFAYGLAGKRPILWTPAFDRLQSGLHETPFVPCRSDASRLDQMEVTTHPDETRSASGDIGVMGGSVETVASDGTLYRLNVPPGALMTPTRITIAPTAVFGVEGIAELTLAAVDLQPAGLRFRSPATLSVLPPAGTELPTTGMTALAWEAGTQRVERPAWYTARDGTLRILVEHFSGTALINAREEVWEQLLETTIAAMPAVRDLAPQAAALTQDFVQNVPGAREALVALLGEVYLLQVEPQIARGDLSLVDFAMAEGLLRKWGGDVQLIGLGDAPAPPPLLGILADFSQNGADTLADRGALLLRTYSDEVGPTSCQGPVQHLLDWVAIPLTLGQRVQDLDFEANLGTHFELCVRLAAMDASLPSPLLRSQRELSLQFALLVSAPAGTPGGTTLADGRVGFPEPAFVSLSAEGGTFPDGSTRIEGSFPDGRVDLTIDRGSNPGLRSASVTLEGTAQSLGIFADMSVAAARDNVTPLAFTAEGVQVAVDPDSFELEPGASRQFLAMVSGTPNALVTWSTTRGVINATGLLIAPSTPGTFTVRAASVVDPDAIGEASVTVREPEPDPEEPPPPPPSESRSFAGTYRGEFTQRCTVDGVEGREESFQDSRFTYVANQHFQPLPLPDGTLGDEWGLNSFASLSVWQSASVAGSPFLSYEWFAFRQPAPIPPASFDMPLQRMQTFLIRGTVVIGTGRATGDVTASSLTATGQYEYAHPSGSDVIVCRFTLNGARQ